MINWRRIIKIVEIININIVFNLICIGFRLIVFVWIKLGNGLGLELIKSFIVFCKNKDMFIVVISKVIFGEFFKGL